MIDLNNFENIGLTTVASTAAAEAKERSSLGQADFLELMTTQLKNQDPMEPMDNGEFLGQIAQFGTVNGVTELNAAFNGFAGTMQSSQALQAANLIGRQVLVENDEAYLSPQDGMTGAVELDSSAEDVVVNIFDAVGQVIGRVELGAQESGLVQFNWDGVTLSGADAAPGRYQVEIEATRDGESEALLPLVSGNVTSLTIGKLGQEMQVELEHLGPVGFGQVQKIL